MIVYLVQDVDKFLFPDKFQSAKSVEKCINLHLIIDNLV